MTVTAAKVSKEIRSVSTVFAMVQGQEDSLARKAESCNKRPPSSYDQQSESGPSRRQPTPRVLRDFRLLEPIEKGTRANSIEELCRGPITGLNLTGQDWTEPGRSCIRAWMSGTGIGPTGAMFQPRGGQFFGCWAIRLVWISPRISSDRSRH